MGFSSTIIFQGSIVIVGSDWECLDAWGWVMGVFLRIFLCIIFAFSAQAIHPYLTNEYVDGNHYFQIIFHLRYTCYNQCTTGKIKSFQHRILPYDVIRVRVVRYEIDRVRGQVYDTVRGVEYDIKPQGTTGDLKKYNCKLQFVTLSLFRIIEQPILDLPTKTYRLTRSVRHDSCHICLIDFANAEKVDLGQIQGQHIASYISFLSLIDCRNVATSSIQIVSNHGSIVARHVQVRDL